MQLEIISFDDLLNTANQITCQRIKTALFESGIVGIKNVPAFEATMHAFIKASRSFSALPESIKQQYTPNRDNGDTPGYELGAEWFKDHDGNWKIDDKKASFYAYLSSEHPQNKWPNEIDLKKPYLNLGKLIFETGKRVLHFLGLNDVIGIHPDDLYGYGRMLHYHKESEATNANPDWCGAHFDHGIFTGLAPAYYFKDEKEVKEPEEAGLFIMPTNGNDFLKVNADKSIMLFQTGEFGQLAADDHIRATKHLVKKAKENIERFTLALFFNPNDSVVIQSKSQLTKDARYTENMQTDGSISYGQWQEASLARYRAETDNPTHKRL